MSISGEEIFEIGDFTAATDLERFVVALEAVILEWQLNGRQTRTRSLSKGCLQSAEWKEVVKAVKFGVVQFRLAHCFVDVPEIRDKGGGGGDVTETAPQAVSDFAPPAVADLADASNDFCSGTVAKFFGLSEYLLLSAQGERVIDNEEKRQALLSALYLVSNETECCLPLLVQFDVNDRLLYSGVCQNRHVCVSFESVHMRIGQDRHKHMQGLLDLFKEKVACPLAVPPPVKVSVRLEYALRDQFEAHWTQDLSDFDHLYDGEASAELWLQQPHSQLPFGATQEPLDEFRLAATWPNLNEDMIVENENYTDLDPLSAPHWSASCTFNPAVPCQMHECLRSLLDSERYTGSCDEILGIQNTGSPRSAEAFRSLTSAPIQRTFNANLSLTNLGAVSDISQLPLSACTVENWISAIFGADGTAASKRSSVRSDLSSMDMDDEPSQYHTSTLPQQPKERAASPGAAVKVANDDNVGAVDDNHLGHPARIAKCESFDAVWEKLESNMRLVKSAPFDSLAGRIGSALCMALGRNEHGLSAFCQLWREIVMTLRDHWESGAVLHGVPTNTVPDLGSCLLNQKLTMLQCCIEAKLKRHKLLDQTSNFSDTLDSDDQFFDAADELPEDDEEPNFSGKGEKPTTFIEPRGRLSQCGDLTLLSRPGVALYIPVTQDPSPMTEDAIEAHTDFLQSLEVGVSTAEFYTDHILSDMQAFKAANPGCEMADFVRWHSPRDYVLEDGLEQKGHLSERMSNRGNIWAETWKLAKPIPVALQKRLFNESKETEKLLHWMAELSVGELVRLILPVIFSNSVRQLAYEGKEVGDLIEAPLQALSKRLNYASRHGNSDDYRDLLKHIYSVELTVSRYRTLIARLSDERRSGTTVVKSDHVAQIGRHVAAIDLHAFATFLVRDISVSVFGGPGGKVGKAIRQVFAKQGDSAGFPKEPTRKEYVMRWRVQRPSECSRPTVQRMYACVDPWEEFRLMGAFSEDVTLFL